MESEKTETWMFREKGETFSLFLSIILVLLVGYISSNISFAFTIAAIAIGIVYIVLQQAQLIGNALKVSEDQFPKIYNIFEEHRKKLGIKHVSLFIRQDPNPNGFTIGLSKPSVILTSSLVENLNPKELSFVIGHELGHVKAGHNIILTFINPLGTGIPAASYLFLFWQRKAEYTSDKCSLILNKEIEPAIDALMKISIGMNLVKDVNLHAYKEQLIKSGGKMTIMSELLFDHPLTTNRVRKMVYFWRNNFIIK